VRLRIRATADLSGGRLAARVAALAALVWLLPGRLGAESPWGGDVGLGLSQIPADKSPSPIPEFEGDAPFLNSGSRLIVMGDVRRTFSGPFRVGLRASYFSVLTDAVYYCHIECGLASGPAQTHVFSTVVTLSGEWPVMRILSIYAGGGYGPALLIRAPRDAAAFDSSDRELSFYSETHIGGSSLLFLGIRPTPLHRLISLEVAWRNVYGFAPTQGPLVTIGGLELGARVQFGP